MLRKLFFTMVVLAGLTLLGMRYFTGPAVCGQVLAFGKPLAHAYISTAEIQGIKTNDVGEFRIPVPQAPQEIWFHIEPPSGADIVRTAKLWLPRQVVYVEVDLGSAGVAGVVRDAQTDTPIVSALVKLVGEKLSPVSRTAEDGSFFLGPVPPEQYILSVEADGYRASWDRLDLSDGRFVKDKAVDLAQ